MRRERVCVTPCPCTLILSYPFFPLTHVKVIVAQELFDIQRKTIEPTVWEAGRFQRHTWWFFLTSMFYLYGRFVRKNLAVELAAIAGDNMLKLTLKVRADRMMIYDTWFTDMYISSSSYPDSTPG